MSPLKTNRQLNDPLNIFFSSHDQLSILTHIHHETVIIIIGKTSSRYAETTPPQNGLLAATPSLCPSGLKTLGLLGSFPFLERHEHPTVCNFEAGGFHSANIASDICTGCCRFPSPYGVALHSMELKMGLVTGGCLSEKKMTSINVPITKGYRWLHRTREQNTGRFCVL